MLSWRENKLYPYFEVFSIFFGNSSKKQADVSQRILLRSLILLILAKARKL
jgi:hypothetical protein